MRSILIEADIINHIETLEKKVYKTIYKNELIEDHINKITSLHKDCYKNMEPLKLENTDNCIDVFENHFTKFLCENNYFKYLKIIIDENYLLDIYLKVYDNYLIIPKYFYIYNNKGIGKLKEINTKEYHRIYKYYICSSILRIGREIFYPLPINNIVVSSVSDILNKSTGHSEEKIICSVVLFKEKFETFNFNLIDPTETIKIFPYNINYKEKEGFYPVDKVKINK